MHVHDCQLAGCGSPKSSAPFGDQVKTFAHVHGCVVETTEPGSNVTMDNLKLQQVVLEDHPLPRSRGNENQRFFFRVNLKR